MSLTAERLRALLTYDPATGLFRWLVTRKNGIQAGTVAGYPGSGRDRDYIIIGIDNRIYYAHRLAWLWMTGEWPRGRLDHRDGPSNAWSNLRLATASQNAMNRKVPANNASGFKGVDWVTESGRWRARIMVQGRRISLGFFATAEEAGAAYRRAAIEHHGEFARQEKDIETED